MKKLFKVIDDKYGTDITDDCYMDSDGTLYLHDWFYDSDSYELRNIEQPPDTFQKNYVQYPRYTIEKYF